MHWVSIWLKLLRPIHWPIRLHAGSTSVKNGDDAEQLLPEAKKQTKTETERRNFRHHTVHNEKGFYLNALYITLNILLITFTCINSQSEM